MQPGHIIALHSILGSAKSGKQSVIQNRETKSLLGSEEKNRYSDAEDDTEH